MYLDRGRGVKAIQASNIPSVLPRRVSVDRGPLGVHNGALAPMFTALLIAILIVTGAATVVGGGVVLAAARRRELGAAPDVKQLGDGSKKSATTGERDFSDLRVGDIVQHNAVDYLVEGMINYDESGHRWQAARLTDGATDRWMMVGLERMGETVKRLLEVDTSTEIAGFPPETIVLAGTRYNLEKRGTATTSTEGEVGRLPGYKGTAPASVGRCLWWQYEGAGADTLIIEQWADEFRVLRGSKMTDTDLEFLPGS